MKIVTVDAGSGTGNDMIELLKQANSVARFCARKVANSQSMKKNMIYAILSALIMVACATEDEKMIRKCIRMARTFSL